MIKRDFRYTGDVAFEICKPELFDEICENYKESGKSYRVIHKPYSTILKFKEPREVSTRICRSKLGGFCKLPSTISSSFTNTHVAAVREIHKDFMAHLLPLVREGRLEPIKPTHPNWPSSFVFRERWNEIDIGEYLWYLDFDNFYPSIAVRLGYVSKEIIDKYTYHIKYEDEAQFKRAKNIALSRIRSTTKVDYIVDGKFSHTITSDSSYLENSYLNIIQFGRNLINHVCEKYRYRIIGRDIDNIILPEYGHPTYMPSRYLGAHGFITKRYLCKKISHNQFKVLFDRRIKTIRNVID